MSYSSDRLVVVQIARLTFDIVAFRYILAFTMNKLTYWASLTAAQKTDLARRAETSKAYLSQIIHGFRPPGAAFARRLHELTNKELLLSDLRPDIWPYLSVRKDT